MPILQLAVRGGGEGSYLHPDYARPKAPPHPLHSFPYWGGCNQLPEDAHPKSFRSMFTYNTNIWATSATAKSRGLMKVLGGRESSMWGGEWS